MVGGRISVIAIEKMTDTEFKAIAFDLLRRELGADRLARFLRLHRSGFGDYTADRAAWQKDLTVNDIAGSILDGRTKIG